MHLNCLQFYQGNQYEVAVNTSTQFETVETGANRVVDENPIRPIHPAIKDTFGTKVIGKSNTFQNYIPSIL